MQAVIDIQFEELLKIVKELPESKLSRLKAELEKGLREDKKRDEFKALLLNGPTFSRKQLDSIAKTRKEINKWRTE